MPEILIHRATDALLYGPLWLACYGNFFRKPLVFGANPNAQPNDIVLSLPPVDNLNADGDAACLAALRRSNSEGQAAFGICDPVGVFDSDNTDLHLVGILLRRPPFWLAGFNLGDPNRSIDDVLNTTKKLIYYDANFATGNFLGRKLLARRSVGTVTNVHFFNQIEILLEVRAALPPGTPIAILTADIVGLARLRTIAEKNGLQDFSVWGCLSSVPAFTNYITTGIIANGVAATKHPAAIKEFLYGVQGAAITLNQSALVAARTVGFVSRRHEFVRHQFEKWNIGQSLETPLTIKNILQTELSWIVDQFIANKIFTTDLTIDIVHCDEICEARLSRTKYKKIWAGDERILENMPREAEQSFVAGNMPSVQSLLDDGKRTFRDTVIAAVLIFGFFTISQFRSGFDLAIIFFAFVTWGILALIIIRARKRLLKIGMHSVLRWIQRNVVKFIILYVLFIAIWAWVFGSLPEISVSGFTLSFVSPLVLIPIFAALFDYFKKKRKWQSANSAVRSEAKATSAYDTIRTKLRYWVAKFNPKALWAGKNLDMPKSRSKLLILLAVVVAATALAAIWRPWVTTQPALGLQKVKVGQVGEFFLYMPLYYAMDRGFFKKEGLEIQIINTGGDEKSVAAVISGDVTFGIGDPVFSPIAGQRGGKTRVVAGVVNGVPFWGVTFRADIPTITDPKELRGFSVATFPSPSTAYTLQAEMFKAGGLAPSIRQAQFGSLLPTIKSGAADIALELEPNVSLALKEGGRVVYSLASRYGDFAITGVTVSDVTIRNSPQIVRKFVQGLDAAERHAHANPADIEEFAVKRFPGLDPQVARSAIRRMLDDKVFPGSANISTAAWEKAVQLRVQAGEITSVKDANQYLDSTFLGN